MGTHALRKKACPCHSLPCPDSLSPESSVSYWATEASTLAINRPAGVDRSSPSLIETRFALRGRMSSNSDVRPLAVPPSPKSSVDL